MIDRDRKTAPEFAKPGKLYPLVPDCHRSAKGIPVYTISAGTEPVARIDFIFKAGTRYQKQVFVAACCNTLLPEGTVGKTGKEIAEIMDFLGSYFYPFCDRDEAGISMYCLEKHLVPSLELLMEILQFPAFPEAEIEIYKAKKQHQLLLDLQKPDQVARKHFIESLFGKEHPYGIHGEMEDLPKLQQKHLKEFHQIFYNPENLKIMLTARDCLPLLPLLENLLDSWPAASDFRSLLSPIPPMETSKPEFKYLPVDEASQTAIRLGNIMPGRHHPDFAGLSVLNTLLGGYFGSRLMQNIREDKGYTYGIGSGLISFQEACILTIGASVGPDVYEAAITECFLEMKRLRDEVVPEDELNRVRNYLIGDLQRQLDGPFNIADTFKSLLSHGLDFSDLDHLQKVLADIQAEELRELANKYLIEADFHVFAAGPKQLE